MIDHAIEGAFDDLSVFLHQPILTALKTMPNGVKTRNFFGVEHRGVHLGIYVHS
jgi:hypothetical protein